VTVRAAKAVTMGGLGVVLAVAALGLALRLYLGRDAESRLRPGEAVAFDAPPPAAPNAFLACPPGRCGADAAESPVFDMAWEQLRERWRELIALQPRVELVSADPGRRRLVYVQRSALLRFPDVVTVEFVGLGAGRSSLFLYSRSRYGRVDFGINRGRVTGWLSLLRRMTGQPPEG
jgi:uncharacterized protein (DUF1499 family)